MLKVWRHSGKVKRYRFREVLVQHASFTADKSLMSFSLENGTLKLLNKKASLLTIRR